MRNKIGEYNIILEEEETNKEERTKEVEIYIKSIKEVVDEPEIEVIHLDKMQNVFNEMFLYNEDKMLGAERVFKYRKIIINNENKQFYYDPLINYS